MCFFPDLLWADSGSCTGSTRMSMQAIPEAKMCATDCTVVSYDVVWICDPK